MLFFKFCGSFGVCRVVDCGSRGASYTYNFIAVGNGISCDVVDKKCGYGEYKGDGVQ